MADDTALTVTIDDGRDVFIRLSGEAARVAADSAGERVAKALRADRAVCRSDYREVVARVLGRVESAIDAASADIEGPVVTHLRAGCGCPRKLWCEPHGWAGTVPDDHSICASHEHVHRSHHYKWSEVKASKSGGPAPRCSVCDEPRESCESVDVSWLSYHDIITILQARLSDSDPEEVKEAVDRVIASRGAQTVRRIGEVRGYPVGGGRYVQLNLDNTDLYAPEGAPVYVLR